MKNLNTTSHLVLAATACLCLSQVASAVLIQGQYVDTAGCDTNGPQTFTHEIGDITSFPVDEGLAITVVQSTLPSVQFECVGDDGIANEWLVVITNLSNIAYQDLYYVADEGVSVGNFDGFAEDIVFPGFTTAFRIDGTVTPGVNNPLIAETGIVDEILQPGETWEFTITNFSLSVAPSFNSVGHFAVSSTLIAASNSSILATPVPEPASAAVLALGTAVLGLRRGKLRR